MKHKFYIDPELQFPLIGWLILLVTLQGLFVGWGFHRAISIAQQWERPDQMIAFFATICLIILPIVIFNFAFGSYLSYKIAAPLDKVRRAIEQTSKGNLEEEVMLREGELLAGHIEQVNDMIRRLRHILYRDYGYVGEVNETLTQVQTWLAGQEHLKAQERKDIQKLIASAKSNLSIIGAYFMRGKKGAS